MLPGRLNHIDEKDVEALVGETEGLMVEFKEKVPDPGKDKNWKRVLQSTAAFATTRGGDIIFGVSEEKGIAKRLSPIPSDQNPDQLIRQIEQKLRSKIFPPPTLHCESVKLRSSGYVIVVRVFNTGSPHQLDDKRFYTRNNRGNDPMSWQEVQSSFSQATALLDRIATWRNRRISNFHDLRKQYGIPSDQRCLIFHLVPFLSEDRSSLMTPWFKGQKRLAMLLGHDSEQYINADGVVTVSNIPRKNGKPRARGGYTQLFRDGTIEAVFGIQLYKSDAEVNFPIRPKWFERPPKDEKSSGKNFRVAVYRFLDTLTELQVPYPIVLSMSLDSRGVVFRTNMYGGWLSNPTDREWIDLPAIAVNTPDDVEPQLDRFEEMLWNAFGAAHPRQVEEED